MGGGQQRSNFGRCVFSVTTPATRFTNIDELDDRSFRLGLHGQVTKQPLFLGAGDHHIIGPLNRLNKSASFTAAQRVVQRERLRQALTEGFRVQRLGLVAVANQRGHA